VNAETEHIRLSRIDSELILYLSALLSKAAIGARSTLPPPAGFHAEVAVSCILPTLLVAASDSPAQRQLLCVAGVQATLQPAPNSTVATSYN
jgi:hypothetical protein